MSSANAGAGDGGELIVSQDGSIPADQIARLGLCPGAHLRVVTAASGDEPRSLAGSLPEFPDLSWEAFEKGSDLAQRDLAGA
ncbi:MAG: hypothetical protein JST73_10510 [Actinobacteria bacterium]|nr:hypothetical protein [Actinomycetota bacterium]